eukprot:jgi/Psemu1/40455/gm1.40455_g
MCNPNPRSSHNQASSSSSTSTTSIPASASAPRASSFPASRIRMEPPSPASTSATGVVVVSASGTTMTSSSSSSSSSAGNGDPSRKLRKRPVAASAHQRTESRDEEFVPHGAMALSSSSSAGGEEDDSPPQQEQQQQQRSQVPSPSPLPLPLQQRPAEQQPPQPPQPPQWYEEEDEIPCLVDEDGEEPRPQHGTSTSTSTTTTTNTARWPRRYSEPHHHRKDNNNVSVDVGAHPTTTPPPTLPRLHRSRSDVPKSHGADANVHCADPKQLPQPQPQPQPFFVLDWMLDELVPEDRTAHDLAALFRHSSALDRTPPSPMVQHFLPWLWNNTKEDDNSRAAAATATASSRNTNENENGIGNQMPSVGRTARAMTRLAYYETPIRERERPSTPIRSNERPCPCASPPSSPVAATMDPARVAGPPLLLTPKSSNRRACRMRQRLARQRNQQRVEEWCSDNDNDNDHGNNDEEGVADGSFEIGPGLLLPMNLDRKLQDTEEKAPSVAARAGSQAEADEDEAEDEASAGALPPVQRRRILFPWMPSSTSTPTSPLSGGGETKRNDNDNGTTNNHDVDKGEPNARSPARKSASCPQFADGTASDPEERLRKEQLQKRRRQEQIDRRERRQKLTIVQRSLTMAKGWNTKGLDMAGKAIRAEQEERERERALDDVQMHMRMKMHMHMPDDPDKAASEGSPSATAHEANAPPNPERLWGSALVCWNNALEVYRSLLGPSHERVADVQNNRGIALGKLRRFGEALEALGMALEARKTQQRKRAAKEASSQRQQHQQHQHQHQRGDDGPVGVGNQNQNIASPRHSNEAAASTTEAIVSTLHNISNVHRDACEPRLALEALFEAQKVLRTCTTNANTNTNEASSPSCQDQQYHEWHQSARLSTAIGHVCYESESWWDARDAYGEALQVYQRLSRALARESELVESGVNNPERLEWLRQQWESIQRDVSVLEYDLDELDLRQQAEAGSRTLLLRARRQEQQQQHQQQRRWSPHRQRSAPLSSPAQSGQEPSSSDGTKTIMGFVSHLRT